MISRIAMYHRWRRFQVTSIYYPLAGVMLTGLATVVICFISVQ